MGVVGDLKRYAQFQAAEALGTAAANPGGMAGAGVGLGAGIAMGQQMAQSMAPTAAAPAGGAATPPPIPEAPSYYLAIDGKQQGPFDLEQLREHVGAGTLTRETLVWCKGMASWQNAATVAALADLLAELPPPLPTT